MRLPDEISIEVRGAEDGRPVEGILVWLDTFAFNREHYRTVIGLTDRRGRVSTGREQLLAEYRQAQHDFPMDYKVGLEDADERIAIGVHGGEEFVAQRSAGRASGMVSHEYARLWDLARNEAFKSASIQVAEEDLVTPRLRVEIALPRAAG